ncbi:MAG: hypothetical protein WCJ30_12645, partial [Deltaproteobacteria bacterium]
MPQTGGPITIDGTVCTLDGAPFRGSSPLSVIGGVVAAADGSFYVLDDVHHVRRYTLGAGGGCALTQDVSFGVGGSVAMALPARAEQVSADAEGHVFLSAGSAGTDRFTRGAVDFHCSVRQPIALSPSGVDAFTLPWGDPVEHVRFSATGCTLEPWQHASLGDAPLVADVESIVFLDATQLLVSAHCDARPRVHAARVFDLNGQPRGPELLTP